MPRLSTSSDADFAPGAQQTRYHRPHQLGTEGGLSSGYEKGQLLAAPLPTATRRIMRELGGMEGFIGTESGRGLLTCLLFWHLNDLVLYTSFTPE
jgi:hypothetical protein